MATWYERNATMMKVLLCAFLLLIFLIPASMVRGLITERASRAQLAKNEIYSKWGGTQTLTGPIISVPYTVNTGYTGVAPTTQYFHILPTTLAVETILVPDIRKRGIFETVVYTSTSTITADFTRLIDMVPADKKVNWNKAIITFGVSDTRGIEGDVMGTLNTQKLTWQPGLITADVVPTGIHALRSLDPQVSQKFSMTLQLRGGEMIKFLPVGKTTVISVKSSWVSPSFDGAFLPRNKSLDTH